MNYLIIGSGGREHAITKALNSNNIYCISTSVNPKIVDIVQSYHSTNKITNEMVLNVCIKNKIDMVIIGSESFLSNKLQDFLFENNIDVFGPLHMFSKIELEKDFLRSLLEEKYNPEYYVIERYDEDNIKKIIKILNNEYVIKYSGLKGGKGVKVSGDHIKDIDEALRFCKEIIGSGNKIIIEEKLVGNEFSYHSFCDGISLKHTIPIKDYKRLNNNDCGPNTGSMGAVSCANHLLPFLDENDIYEAQKINEMVFNNLNSYLRAKYRKTLDLNVLRKLMYGYRGIMYGSFIKTKDGVKVIEYNARFGDPEALNLLSVLDTNLNTIMESIKSQTLNLIDIKFKNKYTLSKYLVPEGYPNKVNKSTINFTGKYNDDLIIYANIEYFNEKMLLMGSRSLSYINNSDNLQNLIVESESIFKNIKGPVHYRNDIGCDIQKSNVVNYQNSGVNIDNANNIVDNIGSLIKNTFNENCINEIGDYSGIITIKNGYKDPVLITSMDGVGTKTLFVSELIEKNNFDENRSNEMLQSLGRDIVGHSINDILVKGANPLFFTDYIASSKLDKMKILNIVKGMSSEACKYGLPILGGETAEMPGVYHEGSYDIVGNIVGIAERNNLIDGKKLIRENDICIGLHSVSPHTNGYSLIRKLFEKYNYDIETIKSAYNLDDEFIDWLCTPHKPYYNEIKILLDNNVKINGLVHITGGGYTDNIPRVLPEALGVVLDKSKIINNNFKKLKNIANISNSDMFKTFNCGIGFIIISNPDNANKIIDIYTSNNTKYEILGNVLPSYDKVVFV